MEGETLTSVRMAITEVQALVKAVELAQRGIDTEESKEVAMCMQAAHQHLEWVYSKLSSQRNELLSVALGQASASR